MEFHFILQKEYARHNPKLHPGRSLAEEGSDGTRIVEMSCSTSRLSCFSHLQPEAFSRWRRSRLVELNGGHYHFFDIMARL